MGYEVGFEGGTPDRPARSPPVGSVFVLALSSGRISGEHPKRYSISSGLEAPLRGAAFRSEGGLSRSLSVPQSGAAACDRRRRSARVSSPELAKPVAVAISDRLKELSRPSWCALSRRRFR